MKKEFREWLEGKKRGSTYPYLNNGKLVRPSPDIEKELDLVIKKYDELHKPIIIPQYVAEWITRYREKYDLYPALRLLENNTLVWGEIYEWYRMNTHKFVNAYLTGEYEVEETPLYCALIKGHELITDKGVSTCKYWNFNTYNSDVFPNNRLSKHGIYLTKMSKEDWNELGINDSNADFVKVEEMEE